MKKTELQELIREELKQVLPSVLNKIVERQVQKRLNEIYSGGFEIILKERKGVPSTNIPPTGNVTRTRKEQPKSKLEERSVERTRSPKDRQSQSMRYSKNSMINEILSETKPFSRTERIAEGDNSMASMMQEPNSTQQSKISSTPEVSTGFDHLDKVLNRDYTELIKLAKEKRGKV